MDAQHGNRGRDERTEQLRAEITRLVADATDESRSTTYRDWCARRIPRTQALLFARLDRAAGHRETPELSGPDATVARDTGARDTGPDNAGTFDGGHDGG